MKKNMSKLSDAPTGNSKYAVKRASGKMMYGPGCGANKKKIKTADGKEY
jgi:hypothetical protein